MSSFGLTEGSKPAHSELYETILRLHFIKQEKRLKLYLR